MSFVGIVCGMWMLLRLMMSRKFVGVVVVKSILVWKKFLLRVLLLRLFESVVLMLRLKKYSLIVMMYWVIVLLYIIVSSFE